MSEKTVSKCSMSLRYSQSISAIQNTARVLSYRQKIKSGRSLKDPFGHVRKFKEVYIMSYPAYDPKEMDKASFPNPMGGPDIKVINYPMNPGDACRLMYQKKAPWEIESIADAGAAFFIPYVIPDNVARAFVMDATSDPKVQPTGGKDMFGIEWEYVPTAGGSMVRPGHPTVEDANDLESIIKWPDINSWDWEGCRKKNEALLASYKGKCINTWFFNGFYERLISMMDFENAVISLIDEDQQDAINAFFEKLTDLYIDIIDKMVEYFPEIDVYYVHDDWGSQKSSFFSPATAEEMIVPHMKRFTDHIHSKGKYCHLHSCGCLMNQVENFIKAGWDAWDPQPMNDSIALYEKYGDQIIIGVMPKDMDKVGTDEEERQKAREFAKKTCVPGKPSMLNMYANPMMAHLNGTVGISPAFEDELYIQSRKYYVNNG